MEGEEKGGKRKRGGNEEKGGEEEKGGRRRGKGGEEGEGRGGGRKEKGRKEPYRLGSLKAVVHCSNVHPNSLFIAGCLTLRIRLKYIWHNNSLRLSSSFLLLLSKLEVLCIF